MEFDLFGETEIDAVAAREIMESLSSLNLNADINITITADLNDCEALNDLIEQVMDSSGKKQINIMDKNSLDRVLAGKKPI